MGHHLGATLSESIALLRNIRPDATVAIAVGKTLLLALRVRAGEVEEYLVQVVIEEGVHIAKQGGCGCRRRHDC